MDKLSVHHGHHKGISKPPVHNHGHGHGHGKGSGKGIKVVYISSPMKLTASAEEFRAVVQELTGRDSNVADHDVAGAPPPSPYSSFGRASPTAAAAAGGRAVPPTMATANSGAGRTAEYAAGVAAPPPFQSMNDLTTGSLLYGQDY